MVILTEIAAKRRPWHGRNHRELVDRRPALHFRQTVTQS